MEGRNIYQQKETSSNGKASLSEKGLLLNDSSPIKRDSLHYSFLKSISYVIQYFYTLFLAQWLFQFCLKWLFDHIWFNICISVKCAFSFLLFVKQNCYFFVIQLAIYSQLDKTEIQWHLIKDCITVSNNWLQQDATCSWWSKLWCTKAYIGITIQVNLHVKDQQNFL